jgi:hypothetical protein
MEKSTPLFFCFRSHIERLQAVVSWVLFQPFPTNIGLNVDADGMA